MSLSRYNYVFFVRGMLSLLSFLQVHAHICTALIVRYSKEGTKLAQHAKELEES